MAKTIRQLTPVELQKFDPTRNLESSLSKVRWSNAWARLPELLAVLQEQFGATRVVVFGSLASKDQFTHWSDIDLAVWGISPERFFEAVYALNDCSPDIKVDLIDPERCESIVLKQLIEDEGIEI
jgi:predicted nucleotidyltransferase